MIVRFVAMALFVDMAHLNETEIGIAIQLAGRLAVANQLGHPRIVRTRRREKLFHQRRDFERQLRIFTVPPGRAHFRDVAVKRILRFAFLYSHENLRSAASFLPFSRRR